MSRAPMASLPPPDSEPRRLYGLIAEFDTPGDLVAASARTREEGYRRMDAYSPFPIHEITAALGLKRTKLPIVVLIGGLAGGSTALLMQWFSAVVHYPVNVAGKPLASWPMFVPIAFELTILFAAFAAVFGMLGMNGLPEPYHPVFNAPRFALASRDRFFLCIESKDPKFDLAQTRAFLESLGAHDIDEVEE